MLLTPAERDRLLLFTAAELARSRRARGLRLNVPEAIALIADTVCEAARDGGRHAEALAAGRSVLGPDDVLPGVARIVTEVKVEAVFEDGTRLVVVPFPIGAPDAGAGAGAESAGAGTAAADGSAAPVEPVEAESEVVEVVEVEVVNTATVPVSVTSHFHFFEANPRLRFDRAAAYGSHLAVPPGASVRFDPGTPVRVQLVPFGGERVVIGFSGLVDGPLDAPGAREQALERAAALGYLTVDPAATATDGSGGAA
ncbi:MAG TPA: urease subunit gamma [Kineosporiaceae bacterium]|nr:urease subunit gamma [Kineosporiaceae bacterium]